MGKSIKVYPKKRGRPATGRDPAISSRVPQAIIDSIDAWAAAQPAPQPSRSEAVRRLIERGLKPG